MKRKTTIFKTIALAAAMMLGGVSSTWADTSTLYNWGTTTDGGATVWTDAEKSNWTGTTPEFNLTNGLGIESNSTSIQTSTRTLSIDQTAILTYTAEWYVHTEYNANNYAKFTLGDFLTLNMYGSQRLSVTVNGTESPLVTLSTKVTTFTVSCTVNTVTNTITAFSVKEGETSRLSMSNLTEKATCALSGQKNYSTVSLSRKSSAGTRTNGSFLKSLKVVQETQSLAKHGYNLKYMTDLTDDATTVKTVPMTAEEDKVYEGAWVYIENTPFVESETKYFISDDATTSFQITSDNQVCKVKVREAEIWNWTLKGKTSDETDLGVISSGTQVEGETVNTYYKRYLLYNGTLYGLDSDKGSNKDYFKHSFVMNRDNQVETLTYTITDINHVVALVEVEDIEGVTNNIYLAGRSSGGDNANPNGQVIETLPAGSYKIFTACSTKSSDRTINFKCGSTTVASSQLYPSENNITLTNTDWFDLTGVSNEITASFNTTSTNGRIDYLYIQQRYETVADCDNLGYTFSSTLPLDFSGTSVRAYIAKYDKSTYGDVVKLTPVNKVPANTGVLIFSNSEMTNQSIPVTTESTDDVTGNKLVAVNSAMTLSAAPEGYENYVLAIEEGKAVFQLVKTNSASMTAGQAYLQIPKRTADARSLRIVFDDETTGVADVRGKMEDVRGDFFNLQGQRVDTPKKGLYIVNGKKVIVK